MTVDVSPGADSPATGEGGGEAGDASDGGSAGTTNVYAYNQLVTVVSPIQICFAASATASTPGLADAVNMAPQPAGGLGPGASAALTVPSLAGMNVTAFVYYVTSLTTANLGSAMCPEIMAKSGLVGDAGLIGDSGSVALLQTIDFDMSSPIASSVFTTGGSYLLLPSGCPKSSSTTLAKDYCGAKGSALGVFDVYAYGLDTAAPASGQSTLQAAMLVEGFAFDKIPPVILGVNYAGDASTVLKGPEDGGLFAFPAANTPLGAPMTVPSLSGATGFYLQIEKSVTEYTTAETLQASNLTEADLTGSALTLLLTGDPFYPKPADGGLSPANVALRLHKN